MSLAIIAQIESNTANGGSLQGFLTGTDSTTAADTFYPRRLTDLLVNESSGGVPTINTFTPSTGGAGSASTEATFVLVPGTYLIEARSIYNGAGVGSSINWGLYNNTSAAFEVYTGGSEPMMATTFFASNSQNMEGTLLGGFTVSTSNKTYSIRHKASSTGMGRALTVCGAPTTMTGANVNGAAARNTYCVIRLFKQS